MQQIINKIKTCFENGGKLLIFGNGGSMAESSHMATEFIGIGLPAIALSDPAIITALSNDFSYEDVFQNWVSAIVKREDLVIGISSSGRSASIINAYKYCERLRLNFIDFPRKGKTTSEIQENQLKLIHKIYEAFK